MLKQSVIYIADRHTTLYYLVDSAPSGPLPFGSAEAYRDLQARLAAERSVPYSDVSGRPGQLVRRLESAYDRDDFWGWYLSSDDYDAYPDYAWDFSIPVQATLNVRVECRPATQFPCKVSPVPRVLLLPSGWSVWIDLLVTGDHSLGAFPSSIRPAPPSQDKSAKLLTLTDALRELGRGIRIDVFGGAATRDSSTPEQLVVTTVLHQQDELMSLEGLQSSQKTALSKIVHPGRGLSPSIDQIPTMISELDGKINFVVSDSFGRFIWMSKLHRSEGRNHQHLRCYHNNAFRSFILAWHQLGILQYLIRPEIVLTPKLRKLAETAVSRLRNPGYKSASLCYFLDEGDVKRALETIDKRLAAAS